MEEPLAQLIAKLSIDEAGNNGLSPNFNPKKVKQYGLLDGRRAPMASARWSGVTSRVSNGFKFHDGPWAEDFYYDDPKLAETFKWIVDQMNKGFIVPARDSRQLGANGFFAAGKGAMALTGSWMINWYWITPNSTRALRLCRSVRMDASRCLTAWRTRFGWAANIRKKLGSG